MALSITGGDGNVASQANTQSPQTSAGSGAPAAAPSGRVQPGTANSLLRQTEGGVSLSGQALTTVDLGPMTTQTVQASAPEPEPAKSQSSPVLVGLVAALFLVAIIAAVVIAKSAKNTTE